MKSILTDLSPIGDERDSVPVYDLPPLEMKKAEALADTDDDFDPCRCQGLLLGVLIGTLLWSIAAIIWALIW